jgi:hypothetical protein
LTKPGVLEPRPSFLTAMLGGILGLILFLAVVYLAPTLGLALVDISTIGGGVLVSNPDVAFWIGVVIFAFPGILLFPGLLGFFWTSLPGRNIGFLGATIKGVSWGGALWVVSGVVLGIGGALSRIPLGERPPAGLFGLNAGLTAPVVLLAAHLVYGLVVGVVAAMTQGVDPISTLGWPDVVHGDARPIMLEREGIDVPGEALNRGMP